MDAYDTLLKGKNNILAEEKGEKKEADNLVYNL